MKNFKLLKVAAMIHMAESLIKIKVTYMPILPYLNRVYNIDFAECVKKALPDKIVVLNGGVAVQNIL